MADINSITQGSSYTGNAALGGGLGVGVTLDTSPLQRLATFAYYKDKDMWEKKVKDDKMAADKIAVISAFDTTSPLKPYTEDLKKGLDELRTFIRENPNALQYDKDPKLYQELVDRYGALQIKRKNATSNDTLYNAAKAKIELIPNKADRDAQLELLDLKAKSLFSNGVEEAYNQQFESTPELKPEDYKIPTIPMTEAFTITRNANDTVIEGKAYADVDRIKALASAAYFEMKPSLDKNSEEYKKLSPEGKRRAELEDGIVSRKRITLDGIANSVNGLVQEFKAQPGNENVTVAEIPEDAITKNSSIGGFIRLVKGYNKQINELNAATGKKNGYINLDDGATPEEIIELQSFSANGETLVKELKPTVQQTDNAIQLEKIRADKALGWAGLNWDKDKFKLQTQGSEEVKNGATIFAERIYNELKSLADKNGVITPEKARSLTSEQLKYLGYDTPLVDETTGKATTGLKPLSLLKNKDLIQLQNGKILVMADAKFEPTTGKWGGDFDNARTTTVSNIATNRLNEQLKTAGAKELSPYLPLDQGNIEVQSTTSGGGTTQSGSSSTGGGGRNSYDIINPQTGKVEATGVSKAAADKAAAKGYTIK